MSAAQTPALQRLLEGVATAIELDRGERSLLVRYVDGQLVSWDVDGAAQPAAELSRFDGRAPWLLERTGEIRPDLRMRIEIVAEALGMGAGRWRAFLELDDGRLTFFDRHEFRIGARTLEGRDRYP